ncbi:MAG: DUF3470 domain-containing protein [Rhodanobacter sp.]|nr:MAG: DUF3470 domain-containing protein [Rhodanobacter sp.]TAM41326.1 MAG: DUF3470 domain-containing protein [Rhodanobacter sp.]TAN28637.1 MAG: DUF3470 domain-containing protein [Rhodanobacter sp.]
MCNGRASVRSHTGSRGLSPHPRHIVTASRVSRFDWVRNLLQVTVELVPLWPVITTKTPVLEDAIRWDGLSDKLLLFKC